MNKPVVDPNDNRWGNYVPWFFRHGDFNATGNFLQFFDRLSQRLYRLFYYNEAKIQNRNHFGELLESRSFQRYRFKPDSVHSQHALANSIETFFDSKTLKKEMELLLHKDSEYLAANTIPLQLQGTEFDLHTMIGGRFVPPTPSLSRHQKEAAATFEIMKKSFMKRKPILEQKYYQPLFIQRLGVLEVILTSLQKDSAWVVDLITDIRKFFAEGQIMLDIDVDSFQIKLLEEPLLQKEVLDTLLPRLSSHYPDRAKEFVKAYHDMISGKDFDEIFVGAFKTLEELARSITKYDKFEFKESDLKKYFPNLHSTIHAIMIKLNAHRGDEGGHAKKAPDSHEMRYLLFSIMNIALLLLDYER